MFFFEQPKNSEPMNATQKDHPAIGKETKPPTETRKDSNSERVLQPSAFMRTFKRVPSLT